MKKTALFSILLTATLYGVTAQGVKVTSGTHLILSNDAQLVLDEAGLNNEGTIDGSTGQLVVNTMSTVAIQTTSEIPLNGLSATSASGNISLGGYFNVDDVSVSAGQTVTLLDTSRMDINSSLTNYGNFTLESGASLRMKAAVPESNDQSVTVYRNTTFNSNTGKYSLVGAPVQSALFTSLGTSAQDWIFQYDETAEYGEDGSAKFVSPSETLMTSGQGYFSAFTGDENGTVVFSGLPVFKNTTATVTRTDNLADASDVEGYNLIANPFTCPISFTELMNVNGSALEEETIWIWDDFASNTGGGTNADYIAVNALGSTNSRGDGLSKWDGTINVAQGFFIKAASSGTVTFNQAMKTHTGNDDASFYRKAEDVTEKYWLGIQDNQGINGSNTLIGFHPGATYELDARFDASKFSNGFSVFSVLDGKKLAIQGLPENWSADNQPIRIGYTATEAGEATLYLQQAEAASGVPMYLNDHDNGTYIELSADTYTFYSEAGSFLNRFSLSTSPLSANDILALPGFEADVKIYAQNFTVHIASSVAGDYGIYSLDGQLINEGRYIVGEQRVKLAHQGIYIVKLATTQGKTTYRVKVGF